MQSCGCRGLRVFGDVHVTCRNLLECLSLTHLIICCSVVFGRSRNKCCMNSFECVTNESKFLAHLLTTLHLFNIPLHFVLALFVMTECINLTQRKQYTQIQIVSAIVVLAQHLARTYEIWAIHEVPETLAQQRINALRQSRASVCKTFTIGFVCGALSAFLVLLCWFSVIHQSMDDQGPPPHPILTGILTQLRRLTFLERLWLIEAILSGLHSRFFVSQSGFAYDPSGDTDGSEIDVGGPMIPPPNFVAYPSVHMRRWCEHDDSFANSHMEKKVHFTDDTTLHFQLCLACVLDDI